MVGDSWPVDVLGARGAGVRALWLNRFGLPCHEHFAFAGLYNVWGDSLFTMTFVTTAATEWFSTYHNRQPVTLTRDEYDRWLEICRALDARRARVLANRMFRRRL